MLHAIEVWNDIDLVNKKMKEINKPIVDIKVTAIKSENTIDVLYVILYEDGYAPESRFGRV